MAIFRRMKRNVHAWWDWTPDDQKREWRVSKFGKKWTFQSKVKGEEYWENHDPLELGAAIDAVPGEFALPQVSATVRATYEDFTVIDQQVKLRLAKGEKPEEMTRLAEDEAKEQ